MNRAKKEEIIRKSRKLSVLLSTITEDNYAEAIKLCEGKIITTVSDPLTTYFSNKITLA